MSSCCWWKRKPDGSHDTAQKLSTDSTVEAHSKPSTDSLIVTANKPSTDPPDPNLTSSSTISPGPSTSQEPPPKLEEVMRSLEDLDIASQVDAFIQAIDEQLNGLTAQKNAPDTPTASSSNIDKLPKWDSFIQSGIKVLKFVSDNIQNVKGNFFQSGETAQIVGNVLQQIGHLHWTVAGLSIIGYVVSSCHQVSENRAGDVELLKDMCKLAYHIKRLNFFIEEKEIKEKLKDAMLYIIEGSIYCVSQLESGYFSSFFMASINSSVASEIRSKISYLHLNLQTTALTEVLANQSVAPPLSQPSFPKGTVGIKEQFEAVNKLLNMEKIEDCSSRAVVIWGFGGIGKTTLAQAVVSTINREHYNYARILLDEDSKNNNYKEMQKNILKDAFPTYRGGREIKLRDDSDGRDKLIEAFQSAPNKPVFLFIDNVLHAQDLKKILPEDLEGLPQRSRILITARNKGFTDVLVHCGLERKDYPVKTLPDNHAVEILCNDPAIRDRMKDDLEKIVKVCQGIPLVLKIIGAHLRKQEYKADHCTLILETLQRGGKIKEDELSNCLFHFVYDKLEESTQEAFLDICCFFQNSRSAKSIEYIVGADQLMFLQEAAFLDIDKELDDSSVHDIIRSIGRSLSNSSRIIDLNSWREAENDEAKLKGIKGVLLPDNDCMLEKRHLNLMKNTLRILEWQGRIDIHEREAVTLPELRYISTPGDISWLNVEALDKLAVLKLKKLPTKLTGPLKLPESLRKITVMEQPDDMGNLLKTVLNSSLKSLILYFSEPSNSSNQREDNSEKADNNGVENKNKIAFNSFLQGLNELHFLRVDDCNSLCELPEQVCRFQNLRSLRMIDCSNMKRIPESIRQLKNLKGLSLRGCSKLSELPPTFGELTALTDLDLSKCEGLKELPSTFIQLTALTDLILSHCKRLQELPSTFGQLTALTQLDLSNCERLQELPSTFDQLIALKDLDLSNCEDLENFPSTFGQLKALTKLDLSNCKRLEELPSTFGQFTILSKLNLFNCKRLKELPSTFGQLIALTKLNLSKCERLKELPSTFGQLRALKHLNLSNCNDLENLSSTFSQLKALTELDMSNCKRLEELPSTFGQLTTLPKLNLSNCKRLKELPSTFGQLIALTKLNLSGCERLKELPSTFGQLIALKNLNLSNCKDLKKLPSTFGQLETLQNLNLKYCQRLEELPSTFVQLEALQILSMEFCKRLEKLPAGFEKLRSLEYIDLESCDNLESDICQINADMKILRKSEHLCTDCQKDKKLQIFRGR